jgi:dihydrofolate reductase
VPGPGGARPAEEPLAAPNPTPDRLLTQIGAILGGKGTFSGGDPNEGTDREGAFGGRYHGPLFVLTHEPPAVPVDGITFVGDLRTAVTEASAAAGDRYVNVLGANVARQCIEAGLLDEVLVFIAPVLLGDGTRLFDCRAVRRCRWSPSPGSPRTGTGSCAEAELIAAPMHSDIMCCPVRSGPSAWRSDTWVA